DAEAARVAGAPRGQRNHTLNRAAFSLGQLVATGVLQEAEVRLRLREAASTCGLMRDDGGASVVATLNSGLSAGMRQPRMPAASPPSLPSSPPPLVPPAPTAPPLRFLDLAKWQNAPVPERQWAVRDRIPLNNVTLLSGEGAAGKTIVGLQL